MVGEILYNCFCLGGKSVVLLEMTAELICFLHTLSNAKPGLLISKGFLIVL